MEQVFVEIESEMASNAAQAVKKCGRCGGTNFEGGHMIIPHSGDVVFRLFKTSASQRFPNITVTAEICLSCGALEFTADPEKARELLK